MSESLMGKDHSENFRRIQEDIIKMDIREIGR
jgi:hypothetical protein